MSSIYAEKFTITVRHWAQEQTADGRGVTTRRLPDTSETVSVTVDLEKLAQLLGPKACHAKSGKSVYVDGCVIVRKHKVQP
jgi:hypothetical protein